MIQYNTKRNAEKRDKMNRKNLKKKKRKKLADQNTKTGDKKFRKEKKNSYESEMSFIITQFFFLLEKKR